jgi:hypothetical protein
MLKEYSRAIYLSISLYGFLYGIACEGWFQAVGWAI